MKNEEPNVAPFSGLTDEQLEEQKNATKESLSHWQHDILNRLNRGEKIINDYGVPLRWSGTSYEEVKSSSAHCALCGLYRADRWTVDCESCPLRIVTQKTCNSPSAPWINFINNPDKYSAMGMAEALRKTYIQLLDEIQFRRVNAIIKPLTKAEYRVFVNPQTTPSTLEEATKHAAKLRQEIPSLPTIEILKIVEVSRPELKYAPKSVPIKGSWTQEEIDTLIKYADTFICETQARLGRTSSSVAYKLVAYLASEGVALEKIRPLNKEKNKQN